MAHISEYERVLAARAKERPTARSYINNIFENFTELHGDRRFGDDKAVIGGVAFLYGFPYTVIALEICIVDTSGAYCGIDAEERGQGQAIAENLYEMITLKTPIVSLLIGEGGSGGALALAVADEVWMMENSVYSVISPEGCASILWKDAKKAAEAAKALKLTASDLLSLGVIDRVIRENGKDFTGIYHTLKKRFRVSTERKLQMPVEDLVEQRYKRFRKM